MDARVTDQSLDKKHGLARRLDAVGWGLFLIWIGTAFLMQVPWGIGLLGVGIIVLGGQAARRYVKLPMEWFWLAFGIVFVAWGILEMLQLEFGEAVLPGGVLPILAIVAGVALVVSAVLRKSQH